jgi:hypothetical protein
MGYERTFRLATNSFGSKEKEQLKQLLEDKKMKYMYLFKERCKWYDFVADMKLLSRSFPSTVFYGAYVGEDLDDNEYLIFHRGCSMPSPETYSFKLPLNEKVINLTKIVRQVLERDERRGRLNESSDSDEDHYAEEEMADELTMEREKLIDNFFSQLNLVEISDLFDLVEDEEDEDRR